MKAIKFFAALSILLWVLSFSFLTPMQSYKKTEGLPPMGSVKQLPNPQYGAIIQLIEDGHFICSAVVVDALYALTAGHCLDGDRFTIKDENGQDTGVIATTIGRGGRVDFGMVKGDFKNFKFMKAEYYKEGLIEPGPFIACGFPYGVKKLVCSEFRPIKREGFMVGGFGSLYPGMSGGPVINVTTDTVVAVNSAVGDGYTYVTSIIGINAAFLVEP